MAYGQLLKQQLADVMGVEEAGMIDRLLSQTERLSDLVRLLLDTTRISEDGVSLECRWFDWNAMVQHSIEGITGGRSIVFAEGDTGMVYADETRIRQVCVNLLTNAVKFSPED